MYIGKPLAFPRSDGMGQPSAECCCSTDSSYDSTVIDRLVEVVEHASSPALYELNNCIYKILFVRICF